MDDSSWLIVVGGVAAVLHSVTIGKYDFIYRHSTRRLSTGPQLSTVELAVLQGPI